MTINRYVDIWNSGAASKGTARTIWESDQGPSYVREHWSVAWARWDRGSSQWGPLDGFDDISGTGVISENRAEVARDAGKRHILMAELRADVTNKGLIRPVGDAHNAFGVAPYTIQPARDAQIMIRKARERGSWAIEVMNEVFVWPFQPTVKAYEALVAEVLEQAGDEFRVIADYFPALSPDIAKACYALDDHFFPRSSESLSQVLDRIDMTATAIDSKGGTPCCLEFVVGRNFTPWRGPGIDRHARMLEAFEEGGYVLVGLWWGYAGSGETWTAPGWGKWNLWLLDDDRISPAGQAVIDGMGAPPRTPEEAAKRHLRGALRRWDDMDSGEKKWLRDDGFPSKTNRNMRAEMVSALDVLHE